GVPQVAFFSVSSRLDAEGKQRIQTYNDAGHIIANHTHTHPDFNKLSLAEYKDDFLAADTALDHYSNFQKLFRFPYLREGNTLKKRDGLRAILKQHNYRNAYVTLNNYDWYIESLFQKSLKNGTKINFEKLGNFYVGVLLESIEYYDQMARKHIGRSPKHVLLLHENDIAALFIDDLVAALKNKGWKIITPTEAYTDQLVDFQVERIFKFNPGKIGEIARVKGQKKGLWHHTFEEAYLDMRFKTEVLGISNQ
ncbi:MAG: polysaccharide deacetylase family protein, partial [Kangiellaceae bacterium]|nr:polysaccharide deacetylase family protein [Kangiellaceae bacterium]